MFKDKRKCMSPKSGPSFKAEPGSIVWKYEGEFVKLILTGPKAGLWMTGHNGHHQVVFRTFPNLDMRKANGKAFQYIRGSTKILIDSIGEDFIRLAKVKDRPRALGIWAWNKMLAEADTNWLKLLRSKRFKGYREQVWELLAKGLVTVAELNKGGLDILHDRTRMIAWHEKLCPKQKIQNESTRSLLRRLHPEIDGFIINQVSQLSPAEGSWMLQPNWHKTLTSNTFKALLSRVPISDLNLRNMSEHGIEVVDWYIRILNKDKESKRILQDVLFLGQRLNVPREELLRLKSPKRIRALHNQLMTQQQAFHEARAIEEEKAERERNQVELKRRESLNLQSTAEVEIITTAERLLQEGRDQKHCVWAYTSKVPYDVFLHVQGATAWITHGWYYNNAENKTVEGWHIAQFYGPCNEQATTSQKVALLNWCHSQNFKPYEGEWI